jgi:hypothetical protein
MVKYICFCMMTQDFLKLELSERQNQIPKWSKLANEHGLKLLFWGPAIGIKEHAVVVYDGNGSTEKFLKFQREWLKLGTPEAGKQLQYVRTVTVH